MFQHQSCQLAYFVVHAICAFTLACRLKAKVCLFRHLRHCGSYSSAKITIFAIDFEFWALLTLIHNMQVP